MADILKIPGLKDTFVVGLSWRHEDEMPGSRELAALSREHGRWGVTRRTRAGAVQAGFCDPIDEIGKPGRVRALAAIVAEQRPQPWLGLFQLDDDRYWLIAVRNAHEIIPDGDFVGTLDDALRLREEHLRLDNWNPPVEGNLAALADIIDGSGRAPFLRDFQRTPLAAFGYAACATGVALAAAGGAFAYHHHQVIVAEQAEAARKQAFLDALQAGRDARARILPWTQQPTSAAVFDACSRAWSAQDFARKSWSLDAWTCSVTSTGISVGTEWTGGNAADAPGALSDDATHARASSVVKLALAQGQSSALQDDEGKRQLWAFAERYAFGLNLQRAIVNEATAGSEAKPPPVPSWSRRPVVLSFDFPPWLGWGRDLDSIPGLRITSMTWIRNARAAATKQANATTGAGVRHWQAELSLYSVNVSLPSSALPHRTARHHSTEAKPS